jgi:glycerol-3-phosphate cytidylyltransferase
VNYLFGVFDYFHLGHLRLFKQAKEKADYLIVAVQDSNYVKKFKPDAEVFYSTEQKVELLKSIKEIDEVIIYKEATPELLNTLNFDILGLGEDQKNERFDKLIFWCNEHNKKMVRLKRTKNISSTEIKLNLKR